MHMDDTVDVGQAREIFRVSVIIIRIADSTW